MRIILVGVIALALCSCAKQAAESNTENPSPAVAARSFERTKDGPLKQVETQVIEVTASVQEVNHEKRWVKVKSPNGKEIGFTVSPQVKRFNEVKVGDQILTRYVESLGFEVRDATPEELKAPRTVVGAAAKTKGEVAPGMAVGAMTHTIVKVESIDLVNKTATLKLPEGNSVTIPARHPENLERVKVGDTIAVTYAEAMAIAIEPVS